MKPYHNQFNRNQNQPRGERVFSKPIDESLTQKQLLEEVDEIVPDTPTSQNLEEFKEPEPEIKEEPRSRKLEVKVPSLNFRSSPEIREDNIIMTLKKGRLVKLIKECDNLPWYHVFVGLTEGFVLKEFVEEV